MKSRRRVNQELLVADWNRSNKVGADVIVTRDNGDEQRTKTRSEAWVLSGHSAVVQLDGISGCYALERVRACPSESSGT